MNAVLCQAPCPVNPSQGTERVSPCPHVFTSHCLRRQELPICSPFYPGYKVFSKMLSWDLMLSSLHLAGGNSEVPGGKNEFPKLTVWESVVKQKEVQRFLFPNRKFQS